MNVVRTNGREFTLMECPFCARNPSVSVRTNTSDINTWIVTCKCGVSFENRSPEMMQLRWNTRDNNTHQVSLTRSQFRYMESVFRSGDDDEPVEEVMFDRATMEVFDVAHRRESKRTQLRDADVNQPVLPIETPRRQVRLRKV